MALSRLVGPRVVAALSLCALLLASQPAPALGQVGDAPGRPTNLTGTVEHDRVVLSWDAPADSTVTGYQILRLNRAIHRLGEFQVHVEDTGGTATTYTDTDVDAGARYVYRVKARNGDAIGRRSTYFDANLPERPPAGSDDETTMTIIDDDAPTAGDESSPEPEEEQPETALQKNEEDEGEEEEEEEKEEGEEFLDRVPNAAGRLVSNTNETHDDNRTLGSGGRTGYAGSFTTGSNSGGYSLQDVRVRMGSFSSGSAVTVRIYNDSSGSPGTVKVTLTTPDDLPSASAQIVRFTAEVATTLDADTQYWVAVERVSGSFSVARAATNGQSGESGWTIGDNSLERGSGDWSDASTSNAELMFSVWGEEGTATPPALDADFSVVIGAGDQVALTFDQDIDETTANLPPLGAFTVEVDGAEVPLADLEVAGSRDDQIKLNLATGSVIHLGRRVTVSYTDPTTGDDSAAVQDIFGNDAASFAATEITNVSNQIAGDAQVSNTDRADGGDRNVDSADTGFASAFTTGSNAGGYAFGGVEIRMGGFDTGDDVIVKIYSDSGNRPNTALHTLINHPSLPFSDDDTVRFGAPAGTVLDASTTYWVAVERVSGTFTIARTASNDQTGETGWGIGNDTRQRGTGDWSDAPTSDRHLMFTVKGSPRADTTPPALDAGNSFVNGAGDQVVLTFSEDIDETTANLPPLGAFTVEVDGAEVSLADLEVAGSRDDQIKLNLESGSVIHLGQIVTVSYTDPTTGDDTAAIQDAASNDAASFAATEITNGSNQLAGDTQVSNTGQTDGGDRNVDSADTGFASAFTTGSNTGGYTFGGVEIRMGGFDTGDDVTVKIYSDSGNRPNTALHTLINQQSLPSSDDQTVRFGAPAGTVLDASTTYWVAVERVSGTFTIARTASNDQTGETGWSIGNDTRQRGTGDWSDAPTSDRHLMFTVKGGPNTDTTPPALDRDNSFVSEDGEQVVLTFDEDIDETAANLPPLDAFTVRAGGTEVALAGLEVAGSRDDQIKLNLASGTVIRAGPTVTVSYTDPTAGDDTAAIQDASGNDAASFADTRILNDSASIEDIIVANTAETKSDDYTLSSTANGYASSITTGLDSGGYDLDSVLIRMGGFDGDSQFAVKIRRDWPSAGEHPSPVSVAYTLTVATPLPGVNDRSVVFNAPAGARLEPDTVYWVAVERTGGSFTVARTAGDGQRGESGWSIGDTSRRLAGSPTWSTGQDSDDHLRFAVAGRAGTPDPDREVLVSNLTRDAGTANAPISGSNPRRATSFTTGDNPGGYTVTEIEIPLADVGAGDAADVRIYTDDGGEPDALLHTMTRPGTFPTIPTAPAAVTFAAPAGATLEPATTYWVSVEHASGSLQVTRTDSNTERSAAGWTMGNNSVHSPASDWNSITTNSQALRFRLLGRIEMGPILRPADSTVNAAGDRVILTFDRDIDETTANLPPLGAFTVKADGEAVTLAGLEVDDARDDRIILRLATGAVIQLGRTVTVSYVDPTPGDDTAAVQDANGNDADSFTDVEIVNGSTFDTVAPTLDTAASTVNAEGDRVILTFDEDIDETTAGLPPLGAFTVTADGQAVTLDGVGVSDDRDDRIILSLAAGERIYAAQAVTVSYRDPTPGDDTAAVQDPAGNDAVSFTATPIANDSTRIRGQLVSNFDDSENRIALGASEFASRFTTGANTLGYTVSSLKLRLRQAAGTGFRVRIHDDGPGNVPGSTIHTLVATTALPSGTRDVVFSAGRLRLPPDTNYWIVVDRTSGTPQLHVTDSNDQTGLPGWSIGDTSRIRSGESWTSLSDVILFTLAGVVHSVDTLDPLLEAENSGVNASGDRVVLRFDLDLDETGLPPAGAFTVKADGRAVPLATVGVSDGRDDEIILHVAAGARIHRDQYVTVAYTDPSAGNDAAAVQSTAGVDAESFDDVRIANRSTSRSDEYVWSAALIVGEEMGSHGFDSTFGTLTVTAFGYDGLDFTVERLTLESGELRLALAPLRPLLDGRLTLHVGGAPFRFADATRDGEALTWQAPGLAWSTDELLNARITSTPSQTLVTNLDSGGTLNDLVVGLVASLDVSRAQSFRTGRGPAYDIHSVVLHLSDSPVISGTPVVRIHEDDGGLPGAPVATLLTAPEITGEPDSEPAIFAAPAGTRLAGSSTYWLLASHPAGSHELTVTSTADQDGVMNWTVGNSHLRTDSAGEPWSDAASDSNTFRMAVNGTAADTMPTPAWRAALTVGRLSDDLLANSTTRVLGYSPSSGWPGVGFGSLTSDRIPVAGGHVTILGLTQVEIRTTAGKTYVTRYLELYTDDPLPGGAELLIDGVEYDMENVAHSLLRAEIDDIDWSVGQVVQVEVRIPAHLNLATVAASFGEAAYYAGERGQNAVVEVRLSEAPGRAVTLPLLTENLGNAGDGDYSGVPEYITFAGDETVKTFEVAATPDGGTPYQGESEDERVRITFGDLPDGVLRDGDARTEVYIVDDILTGWVEFPDGRWVTEGEGPLKVRVVARTRPNLRLNSTYEENVVFGTANPRFYSVVRFQRASETDDFTRHNRTIILYGSDAEFDGACNCSVIEHEFEIAITDDTAPENTEELILFLQDNGHGHLRTREDTIPEITSITSYRAFIVDDDGTDPVVSIEAVNSEVTEGEPVAIRITAERPPTRNTPITLDFSETGDTLAASGRLTYNLPLGATERVVYASTVNDADTEDSSRVTVTIGHDRNDDDQGYQPGPGYSVTVQVRDNDEEAVAPGPPATLSAVAGNRRVTLSWTAPLEPGDSPLRRYEILDVTSGIAEVTDVGTRTSHTFTNLTNGTLYVWMVRAVSDSGTGARSFAVGATPAARQAPTHPTWLAGDGYDGSVVLTWGTPEHNGGSPVTRYEVRHGEHRESQQTVYGAWRSAGNATRHTVTGLAHGRAYDFQVRAVNAGNARSEPAEVRNVAPQRHAQPMTVGIGDDENLRNHSGRAFTAVVRFSQLLANSSARLLEGAWPPNGQGGFARDMRFDRRGGPIRIPFFQVSGGRIVGVAKEIEWADLAATSDRELDIWNWRDQDTLVRLTIQPSSYRPVTVAVRPGSLGRACDTRGHLCSFDHDHLSNSAEYTFEGPRRVTVSDASAREGTDSTMTFRIRLSEASAEEVHLTWSTGDLTARHSGDYESGSGQVTFAPGETTRTVTIGIRDDNSAEGTERFRLIIRTAQGAVIADGEAIGTITDND